MARALRAFVRSRLAEAVATRDEGRQARLTHMPAVVDPPVDKGAPIGEPPFERSVEIPLYLEP